MSVDVEVDDVDVEVNVDQGCEDFETCHDFLHVQFSISFLICIASDVQTLPTVQLFDLPIFRFPDTPIFPMLPSSDNNF